MRCKIVNKILYIFSVVMLTLVFSVHFANATVKVRDMRIGNQSDGARIVFDVDSSVNYRTFLLDEPKRLVIDIDDAGIAKMFTNTKNQMFSKVRVGKLDGNNKRIVLDLARPCIIKKAFMLQPQSGMPWRFVVDVRMAENSEFNKHLGQRHAVTNDSKFSPKEDKGDSWWSSSEKSNTSGKAKKRKRIIVLDPGHGGKDPGAIGAHGKTYEKNVTLAVAKQLQTILRNKGYTVYLTRSTDVFIPLRQRIKIAQHHKADLFMSLHADSAKNHKAKGLSVYTLSDTASDKEAAALADRENKADIIGGVDLGGNTREVNNILISLSQTDSRNKSSKYATYLVQEMAKSVKLVKNTHRFAGFAVLKAPDIPSVLLEMGYLSNQTEERNLKTAAYRKKLAISVSRAIDRYFNDPEIASN